MKKIAKGNIQRWTSACLAVFMLLMLSACGGQEDPKNLIPEKPDE